MGIRARTAAALSNLAAAAHVLRRDEVAQTRSYKDTHTNLVFILASKNTERSEATSLLAQYTIKI